MSADTSPRAAGYRQPAEWAAHEAVWSAFPYAADEWSGVLEGAREEILELWRAIADEGRGERLRLLVRPEEAERVRAALDGLSPELFVGAPFGDAWLRDTAPIFVSHGETGAVRPVCLGFNGWGQKYEMPGDAKVSAFVAEQCGGGAFAGGLVLEGGSVDVDGEGTVLTTRQCLLERRRNPDLSAEEIEARVLSALGAEKLVWLQDGLLNDHTDGHVDTLARFVAPGRVVCMAPAGADDPNRAALEAIIADLERSTDAAGRKLEVATLPSPGRIVSGSGELLPASYVNFYIANTRVVVPTYGVDNDAAAVEALQSLFPQHEVVGRSARLVLEGGGAFHCITQQQPKSGGIS